VLPSEGLTKHRNSRLKTDMNFENALCCAVLCCVPQCCQYLSWDRRLMMLHDVAAGMSYLHGRNHIHGDLRSPNLFVGADGKVGVCLRGVCVWGGGWG
jgi:hypothetical protein